MVWYILIVKKYEIIHEELTAMYLLPIMEWIQEWHEILTVYIYREKSYLLIEESFGVS